MRTFFLLGAVGYLIGVALLATPLVAVVLIFLTARRAPDRHGARLRSAFGLSVAYAGVLGAVATLGFVGMTLGNEAAGRSSRCFGITPARFGTMSGTVAQSPTQERPDETYTFKVEPAPSGPPAPRFSPPVFPSPPRFTMPPFTPRPIPVPSFSIPPGEPPEPIGPPFEFGEDVEVLRCSDTTGRDLVTSIPFLLASTGAAAGGSRTFRTQLKEERDART